MASTRHHNRAQELAERQREAAILDMWARKVPIARIAEQHGYASASTASRAIRRALNRIGSAEASVRREQDALALDRAEALAWAIVNTTHYLIGNTGKLVLDPNGAPMRDWEPVRRTLETILRIQQRRASLLGLDAPQRTRVEFVDIEQVLEAISMAERQAQQYEAQAIEMAELDSGECTPSNG